MFYYEFSTKRWNYMYTIRKGMTKIVVLISQFATKLWSKIFFFKMADILPGMVAHGGWHLELFLSPTKKIFTFFLLSLQINEIFSSTFFVSYLHSKDHNLKLVLNMCSIIYGVGCPSVPHQTEDRVWCS